MAIRLAGGQLLCNRTPAIRTPLSRRLLVSAAFSLSCLNLAQVRHRSGGCGMVNEA